MIVTQLMADLNVAGIQLVVVGNRLRYSPKALLTEELAQRLKDSKPELLQLLAPLPCKVMELDDGWPVNSFEPPEPCAQCDTLELWQTMLGNWRCERCDPPSILKMPLGPSLGVPGSGLRPRSRGFYTRYKNQSK